MELGLYDDACVCCAYSHDFSALPFTVYKKIVCEFDIIDTKDTESLYIS